MTTVLTSTVFFLIFAKLSIKLGKKFLVLNEGVRCDLLNILVDTLKKKKRKELSRILSGKIQVHLGTAFFLNLY